VDYLIPNETEVRCAAFIAHKGGSRIFDQSAGTSLQEIMTPHRIIIDTDPGVDDALTFLLALASAEIKLEALTTTQGNVTVEKATRNALAVLELARISHIAVARGSELPLVQPLLASALVHGESGIGNAQLPEPRNKPV